MAATSISARLFQALNKIDRPGTFCMQGSASTAVLPGLVIRDVGPIGFPLTAKLAKEIKEHCEQAPYGKGEQTIVDTRVRRVWQMLPGQFKLTNPEWSTFLAQTVKTVQQELGLDRQKVEAHLYNLLLYEKGSFFLPHRDGEKLDRMVATLVVVLPSSYQGGELVVRHEGQQRTSAFGTAKNRCFRTHFAAFYADCEHEVRPLRGGYRLCLVYNLTLAKAKKPIRAPRSTEQVEAVQHVLRDWQTDAAGSPRKLAVTLEHEYTQDGLAWDTLKGVDRARAQVLREAARQAGCKAYLALLTFWESGSASADYDGGGYYGRGRWYNDEDEDEDSGGGHYEMEEVFDESLTAEHFMDDEGHRLKLGEMTVEHEEVVPEESLKEVEPEEDFEGYTGNAGMTLERWYRHAAILLWPEKRHFEVLAAGSENPVAALAPLVKKWQKAGPKTAEVLQAQCRDFTRHLIASWKPEPHHGDESKPQPCGLVPALVALDEPKLIQDFLNQVMAEDAAVEVTASLLKLCEKHGWGEFQDAFVGIFKNQAAEALPRNVRLLEQLCAGTWKQTPEWRALCKLLMQEAIAALEACDRKNDWRANELNRSAILAGFVRALLAGEQLKPLTQLLAHIAATPKRYPLTDVQVGALVALRSWLAKHLEEPCAPLSRWLAECRQQLEALTAQVPVAPADFRRDVKISCACRDCQELVRFLKDPQEKVHRFPVSKERRRHLHQMIDSHQCDVTHATEHRGSPQTLVCTKTTSSYQHRLRQYQADKKHLAELRSMEASLTQ